MAHRVIDIKVEIGIYYYWPRGDANSQDDGCWIPDTNVDSYIIELHKNTNPDNQALREKVNSASAAYQQARETYDQKQEYYDGKYLEYCGGGTGTCTLQEPYYSELIQLYNELILLNAGLEILLAAYEQAYNEAIA